jgi:hypothetical protein
MRKLTILLTMFLGACQTAPINSVCPSIVNYTIGETREIERIRIEQNNIVLNRFLKDYKDLRDMVRRCNEVKH